MFFVKTLDSGKAGHSFCQHHAPLVKTRRTNLNLTLKGHVENLTKVKVTS